MRNNHIWAIYLDIDGNKTWEVDAPDAIPEQFTVQDVAVFAKGYLSDYPVFIRNTNDGMLILGYPQDSYMKLSSNYYSLRSIKVLPVFVMGILAVDSVILFLTYYYSKRKILKNTEPIITSIISLSVSDNGVGLSEEKRKELKEKPHYTESTDDRLDLRHGLGLILVKQIMDAHKGSMQIESEEQKGCKTALFFSAHRPIQGRCSDRRGMRGMND